MRIAKHWNRLPWEAVEFPSLESFETSLDIVLNKPLWLKLSLPWAGGSRLSPELHSSLVFVVLFFVHFFFFCDSRRSGRCFGLERRHLGISKEKGKGKGLNALILQRKGSMVSAKQKWWDLCKNLKGEDIIFYGPIMNQDFFKKIWAQFTLKWNVAWVGTSIESTVWAVDIEVYTPAFIMLQHYDVSHF